MTLCVTCGFVFNRKFDPTLLRYGRGYENSQVFSSAFGEYLVGLASHLTQERGVRNTKIVEVGCGDGAFLRLLVKDEQMRNVGIGFDPTHIGPESEFDGRLTFVEDYYDARATDVAADVVVCRHVIEHVDQPQQLLRAVRAATADQKGAHVYFETPCVDWIFRNSVVWDFFYEHCSLFSEGSIRATFERCGFRVSEVQHVFGGQYLWVEASPDVERHVPVPDARTTRDLAIGFARSEKRLLIDWQKRIAESSKSGPVALWGAGAKGATLANLVDPDCKAIDCLIDMNPSKQGKFLPGTGHPIVAPGDISERGIRTVFLMNPNYRGEVEQLLHRNDWICALVE